MEQTIAYELVVRAAPLLFRVGRRGWRRLRRGPLEQLLAPEREGDLVIVLSSVPYRPPNQVADALKQDHKYVVGFNELGFLWVMGSVVERFVAPKGRLRITGADDTVIQDDQGQLTAREEIQDANLIVLGSSAYNPLTKLVLDERKLNLKLTFPPEGGRIMEAKASDEEEDRTEYPHARRDNSLTDWGLLTRVWNPWGQHKTIVILAGTTHLWQLGITRTLRNPEGARKLNKDINDKLKRQLPRDMKSCKHYEALVRVDGRPWTPTLPVTVEKVYPVLQTA